MCEIGTIHKLSSTIFISSQGVFFSRNVYSDIDIFTNLKRENIFMALGWVAEDSGSNACLDHLRKRLSDCVQDKRGYMKCFQSLNQKHSARCHGDAFSKG